nr:YncE family protein [Streptomyces sp. 846.5]
MQSALTRYAAQAADGPNIPPRKALAIQQAIFADVTASAPLLERPVIGAIGPALSSFEAADELAFAGHTALSVLRVTLALATNFVTMSTLTASTQDCANLPASLTPQPTVPATSFDPACPKRPAGPLAFQPANGSNIIGVINPDTGQVYERVTDPNGPELVHLTPDGQKLYVDEENGTISVFDTCSFTFTDAIKAPGRIPLSTLSPDGKRLYTANLLGASATVVDTTTDEIIDTIPYLNVPTATSVSADNKTFYVSDVTGDITAYDAQTFQPIVHGITLGFFPGWLDVSPDGRYLYAANEGDGVTIFDAKTLKVVSQIYTGFMSAPQYVTTRPDGKEIWITNANGTVDVISTAGGSFAIKKVLSFDSLVWTVSFSADSATAYVSEEGNPVETLVAGENSDFLALFKVYPNETTGQTRVIDATTYQSKQPPIVLGIAPGAVTRVPGT